MADLEDDEADFLGLKGEDGAEARLHPLLSNSEVLEARASARRKIEAERRKAAMKQVEDEETARLRKEEGLVTGHTSNDQMVKITLNLAPHSNCIRLNGNDVYYHQFTYEVPRHVANSLREIQARGWIHQDEIDGKSLTQHYQNARSSEVSPIAGVTNAPLNPGVIVREAVH